MSLLKPVSGSYSLLCARQYDCNPPGLVPEEQFNGGLMTGLRIATHREFRQQNHIETLLEFFTMAFRSDAQHLIQRYSPIATSGMVAPTTFVAVRV